MPGLREYHAFIRDLESELDLIGSILARQDASGTPCAPGCSACCRSFTVFPLEAFAIMHCPELPQSMGRTADPSVDACPFLTQDQECAIYEARPFLCRTRGFPVLHLNADGDWERDSCSRRNFPHLGAGAPGLRLEAWNARLFRLNEDFCEQNGVLPRRVALADLRVMRRGAHGSAPGSAPGSVQTDVPDRGTGPAYPAVAAPVR